MEKLKKCSACQEFKPLYEFSKNRSHKDGYSNQCKLCRQKERQGALNYYYKHKEEILKAQKNNPEYKERRRIYLNKWKQENREKLKNTIYKWRNTPSGMYSSLINNKKRKVKFTREEFINWMTTQEEKCVYCGLTIDEIKKLPKWYVRRSGKDRLSIDRKDNSKEYELNNIVLCCYMCNTIKNSFLSYDDMIKVGKLVIRPKLLKLLNKE